MTDQSRGIIYSAIGAQFIAEAISSARSSLRFNRVPHLIFCDVVPIDRIDGIEFVRIESCGDPFGDKIRSIRRLPFEKTLFLDGDTYLTANVDELFDLLNRFDVAAAHAPGYTKCGDTGNLKLSMTSIRESLPCGGPPRSQSSSRGGSRLTTNGYDL